MELPTKKHRAEAKPNSPDCVDLMAKQANSEEFILDNILRGIKRKVGCIEAMTQFGGKRKLDTDYELGPYLGKGTFGVVRLCRHKCSGQIFACKTLPKKTAENVHAEVEIMQHLSGHKNIVTLNAVYEDHDCYHLIVELCHEGSLANQISKYGRFTEYQAANIMKQLLTAIKHCHEMGVVHRDIKPCNILWTGSCLKLADYGLSTRLVQGRRMSDIVGSPCYMAPEILQELYTQKVDVWSAGVILHLLLIGTLPFSGGCDKEIFKAIVEENLDFNSEAWQKVSFLSTHLVSWMLSKDAENRPSAEDVLNHPWIAFYTQSLQTCTLINKKPIEESRKRARDSDSEFQEDLSYPSTRKMRILSNVQVESEMPMEMNVVDALAAALSQISLSEPKKSNSCLPTHQVAKQLPSDTKFSTQSLQACNLISKKPKETPVFGQIEESRKRARDSDLEFQEDLSYPSTRKRRIVSNLQVESQMPVEMNVVDALAAALSKISLSEPKKGNSCLPKHQVAKQPPSYTKFSLCKAL